MNQKVLRIHSRAQVEINEAFEWYFKRGPEAADAFLTEIGTSLKQIAANPQLYPLYTKNTRKRVLTKFRYYQRENPRLCRGGSRSLTFTEAAPGLSFYFLLAEFFERRGAWAPSLRDSGQTVRFAHPALKRGANKHCAYGAEPKLALAMCFAWQKG